MVGLSLAFIRFDSSYFFHLFGNSSLWSAAWITIALGTLSWAVAGVLGVPLALAKLSRIRLLRAAADAYVWVFRGIPQLILILFAFNALPEAVPGTSGFFDSPFRAGAVALIVSEAAYMAEIFRGSLLAVGETQRDAGRALGLAYVPLQRLVVLPQALRVAIPPLGNEYIATLKNTSLVSVISLVELTLAAQRIYAQNFLVIETLTCVAVFYLGMVTLFTLAQRLVERRMDVTRRRGRGSDSRYNGADSGKMWHQRAAALIQRCVAVKDEMVNESSGRLAQHASTYAFAPALVPVGARNMQIETKGALAPAEKSHGWLAAVKRRTDGREGPDPAATTSRDAMVRLRDVKKSFHGREVLAGINLEVARGEVLTLIGPSGSGKSTLLRCLNHLETVDSGRVEVNGHLIGYRERDDGTIVSERDARIARQRAEIGMVFQSFNLFPHRTALDNVTLAPLYLRRYPRGECHAYALELLKKVGLEHHVHHYPHQLSGGQQQRVAIARALAMRPVLMLFDEPTSALDPELVGEVLRVMEDLAAEGMTMVVVTHEMQFARHAADRAVFMADGKVVEQGPPDRLFGAPQDPRTQQFLERFLDR